MKQEGLREVALSHEADKCWQQHPQQHRGKPLPHTMLGIHQNPDKSQKHGSLKRSGWKL